MDISKFFRVIAKKLHGLEDCNWDEIIGRDQAHFMAVSQIVRKARKRLRELAAEVDMADDLIAEDLTSIHITGRQVVWGLKSGANFYLLWWDPKHTVYEVHKKHT